MASRAGRAARQRRRHAALSRRSSDAGRRRDEGREAARPQGRADPDEDPGASDLLRRRAAAPRGARRSRSRRGSGAARSSRRTTSVPGPATVHLKLAFDWKIVPAHDVDRADSRPDVAGRVGPPRQSPRRLGQRSERSGQRPRGASRGGALARQRCVKSGWRPKRTILLCAWDGEEPGLLGSTEWVETHADELVRKGRRLRQHRLERPRLSRRRRLPHARDARRTRSPARSRTRRRRSPVERRARLRQDRAGPDRRRAQGSARAAHLRISRARLGLRLHALPAAPRHRVAEPRIRRRGRRRRVPLDLRRLQLVHAVLRRRLRLRPGTRSDDRAVAAARSPTPTCFRFDFDALADTVSGYVKEVRDLAKDRREAAEELDRRSTRAVRPPSRTLASRSSSRRKKRRFPISTSRRSRTPQTR